MGNSTNSAAGVISKPQGGGALSGIGETFAPDPHTGTGNFTVPLAVPPGRNGLQPALRLEYSTGNGNGPFGLGWRLSVPGIARKTSKGIPRYDDDTDVFILAGAEDLVPVERIPGDSSGLQRTRYQPRTEGLFAQIVHCRSALENYWQVQTKDGLTSLYGTPRPASVPNDWFDPAVIVDPRVAGHVAAWRLLETRDPFGNRIVYEYERDRGGDAGRSWNQPYLKRIRYVDFGASDDAERFLISIAFTYEPRPDAFSDFRSAFEIRTTRRCSRIEVRTHREADLLARSYGLVYLDQRADLADLTFRLPANKTSLLSQIRVAGHDGDQTEELPPLEFGYSRFDPQARHFRALSGSQLPIHTLADPNVELADLFGTGLPDILEMAGTARYWRNLGDGRFATPRDMQSVPDGLQLGDPGVQLLDANGDGRVDLLVSSAQLSGYFPMQLSGGWDVRSFQRYRQAPSFDLKDPEVKLLDLNGDGVTDALRFGTRLEAFFNDPQQGWTTTRRIERGALKDFPDASVADPHVKWGDMSGDGMQDVVLVHDGSCVYWPNRGYGDWAAPVHMRNSPRFPDRYDPKRVLLGDIDGDGAADIVYVEDTRITVWINQCGNGFSEPIVITGTPSVSDADAVRLADMMGNGVDGVLWSRTFGGLARDGLFFLDLTGGTKPYLLNEMNNHLGAVTRVDYAPSTSFWIEDNKHAATRWRTPLPFPVQVVRRVEVIDKLSGGKLATEYRYHHGYWDGAEREFRGFGRVEQFDSESFDTYTRAGRDQIAGRVQALADPQRFSPPTCTKTWFHQGPIGEEFGDWAELQLQYEYWSGDHGFLDHKEGIDEFLRTLPERRVRRDALRALRGSVLRSELYALDATGRSDRPYTVVENAYGLRKEAHALDDPKRVVFFAHRRATRTTQWERGDEPLTQFGFSDTKDYDASGQLLRSTEVACPRTWRGLSDRPDEPFLATRTVNEYAVAPARLPIRDRIARMSSYELRNQGRITVEALHLVADDDASVELIGQSCHYYDGPAFEGLQLGQLGEFGALSRSERLVLTTAILDQVAAGTGSGVPPYLDPNGPQWSAEYPDGFRRATATLAGFRFHAGGPQQPDVRGYFAQTQRRSYDVQLSGGGLGRGLLIGSRDAMGNDSTAEYDPCELLPVTSTSSGRLVTRASYDYRVLQPKLRLDPNGNATEYEFTPLGLLSRSFVRGKHGTGDLKAPSVTMTYDFQAFIESERVDAANPRPIYVHSKRRTHYDSEADIALPERDETIESRAFSDGFGRLLQTRSQAEDLQFGGPAFGDAVLPADQADDAGTRALIVGRQRGPEDPANVVVSGWQVYDNKGRVVETYEPFFSTGYDYAAPRDAELGQRAEQLYDPRGNVICRRNPDGSERRQIFGVPGTIASPSLDDPDEFEPTPWEAYTYDANDNAGRTHPASAAAYRHHWDTPSSVVVDGLGRTVVAIERNRDPSATPGGPLPPISEVATRSTYDIRGNILTLTDALGRVAFSHVHDLGDRPLRIDSIDAGMRRTTFDAAGNPIERRDSKGCLVLVVYDVLDRPTHKWARDLAGDAVTLRERLLYGDDPDLGLGPAQVDASNLLGRPYRQYDEAGRLTCPAYDLQGLLQESEREVIAADQLLSGFAGPPADRRVPAYRVEWAPSGDSSAAALAARAAVLLDRSVHRMSMRFDALGRPKLTSCPEDVEGHRAQLRPTYNRAGSLEQVHLDGATYVERIAYDAKGQRTLIAYGNRVMTRQVYDTSTSRLVRLRTERFVPAPVASYRPAGSVVQDLGHGYDLAGNVLSIRDRSPGSGVLNSTLGADALDRTFVHDALYRLLRADGRECDRAAELPWDDAPRCTDPTRTRTYSERYRYDAADNLLQLKHLTADGGYTRAFSFDSGGSVAGNDRLARMAIGAIDYVYASDGNGNVVQETTSRHFEWDHTDRLKLYRTQTGSAEPTVHAQYLYDRDGLRTLKLVRHAGGSYEVTTYIDGCFEQYRLVRGNSTRQNNLLHVEDERGRMALVRYGAPMGGEAGPPVQYHIGDHLGSSNVVLGGATADAADFVNREEYTPFGETSFGSFRRKRYRFIGKERDEESGLGCHDRRYYAPWLARWLSCDPAGAIDGTNLYGYARTPLAMKDPSGTEDEAFESVGDGSNLEPSAPNIGGEPSVPAYTGPKVIEMGATVDPNEPAVQAAPAAPSTPGKIVLPDITIVATPHQEYTLPETVIEGKMPFEPDVSHPKAEEQALGAGHIEWGDVKAFFQGVVNGPSSWLGLPQSEIDPRFGGAGMLGHEFGQDLALEGAGALVAKGASMAAAALRPATKSSQAYRVIVEVELQTKVPAYVSDAGRRAYHYAEAADLVSQWVNGLRRSANPNDRALAKALDVYLRDASEFALHHHPQREGVMQLVPQVDHMAPEFQDALHPLVGKLHTAARQVGRVGGYFLWGRNF